MTAKRLYLLLAVVGTVVPYLHFFPWLRQHGLDLPLFFRSIHANGISEFFAADVIVSALVLLVALHLEREQLGARRWLPIAALLLVGVSLALPLFLYLREPRKA